MRNSATKERILSASIALMSGLGYEAVTMRMIADRVGLRVASIYNHFSSKEDILNQILDQANLFFTKILVYPLDQLEELMRTKTPEQILTDLIHFYEYEDPSELLQLTRLLYIEQYTNAKIRQVSYRFFFTASEHNLEYMLGTFLQRGLIPPTDTKALAFIIDRTALVFSFIATHFSDLVHNEQYFQMNDFYVRCLGGGIQPVRVPSTSFTKPNDYEELKYGYERMPTRDRIIYTTFQLLDKYGGDKVSMRMICDEVGIQVGSAYSHFSSKEEIFDEVAQLLIRQSQYANLDKQEIKAAIRSGDRERMVAALAECNPNFRQEYYLKGYRVVFREIYRNKSLRDYYWDKLFLDVRLLSEALDELAAEAVIPPCQGWKIATAYIYSMTSINVGGTIFQEELDQIEELRRMVGEWILGLILNGFVQ